MKNSEQLSMIEDENQTSNGDSGNSGILFKSVEEVMHESMIPYTECVVLDRALPRVEDGLKPVQRRILYSMMELGLTPDKPYRKSARIVGDCLGKYHPHGDTSVYDAMCRMAQDFSLRAPLVSGHGNFGSIDGDSPAAMRYTEARMAPLALELLRDLDKDTVRWGLNFDDSLKEPEILPGRFPNLLVNGAQGIAVGVATNIPPHNLGETIDGVVAYIDNPNITLEEMMKIIKAPDFPGGGEIIAGEGLEAAYRTGKGKIILRAKVGVESVGDKTNLVITELPYMVNKAALLQKIAELRESEEDKYGSISDVRDESDRTGMRGVIKLKKDANVKKILENLYKSTNLQISFGINMVAIAGGKPRQMGLLEIIDYYAAYQREIIVRRSKFDLKQAKEREHIVEGLLIAIKNIDEVVKIIRKSPTIGEAKTRLKDRFKLSDIQVQAIMDMRLARLVNLEEKKLLDELKELQTQIARLEKILASKKLQFDVVKKEMLEIKKNYADGRRSAVLSSADIKIEKLSEQKEEGKTNFLAISAGGTIKRIGTKNYSASDKNLKEGSQITDVHKICMPILSSDTLWLFTDKGNCLKIKAENIKECKFHDKGVALSSLTSGAERDEMVVGVTTQKSDGEIVFISRDGMVKRTDCKDLNVAKPFYQVMKLAEGDSLLSVMFKGATSKQIMLLSSKGNCLAFAPAEIPLQGRTAGGVKGMTLEDGDCLVYGGALDGQFVVAVTNDGYMKKFATTEVPILSRNRKGLKYITFEKNSSKVVFATTDKSLIAVDFGLKILSFDSRKLPVSPRLTPGNEIIKKKFFSINEMFI